MTFTPPALKSDVAVTASLSDPDGGVTGASWQWARSSTRDGTFVDISGATSASYTPAAADDGIYLRATVSYADSLGSGKSAAATSLGQVDRNAEPAFDEGGSTARSVAENTAATQNIGDAVEATDADGDTLTYILGGTDVDSFAIVSTSGQLQTKDDLDYETQTSYTVTVSVRDSKASGGSADNTTDDTITVTINVTNVNEDGSVSLSPASPTVGVAVTATLSDPDSGVTGATWQWASSADGTTWADISGATSTSYTPVSADLKKSLRATVAYSDVHGLAKAADTTADKVYSTEAPGKPGLPRVTKIDVAQGTVWLEWGEVSNTGPPPVTYYVAVDRVDALENVLVDDINAGAALSTSISPLTADTKYEVSVIAQNVNGYGDYSDNTLFVMKDMAEGANGRPVINPRLIAGMSKKENTLGSVGDAIVAADPDGDAITWSLGGADAAEFTISQHGQLSVSSPGLDFEAGATRSITVTASDATDSDSEDVTVKVTDVDEDGSVSLSPASPITGRAVTATLTDPDGGVSSTTWQWASSSDGSSGWTDISSATSASYTPAAADVGEYLRATASYTDSFGSGKTASGKTTGAVADNSAPEIGAIPTLAIAENQTGDVGSAFTATDADGDTITWSVSGTHGSSFAISSAGQLSVTTALNFEDGTSRSITVTASDGTDSDSATVTVTVTDDNTEAPGKPAAPTVTAASGSSVTVTWDEPANTGPAITGYGVQYCLTSDDCDNNADNDWTDASHSGTTREITITGLTAATSYDVQVQATNAEGASGWSASGSGTTGALGLVIAPVSTQPAAADRITTLGGLTIAAETDGGVDYDRDNYHTSWKDADSDNCSAREEVLKDEATTLTAVAGDCTLSTRTRPATSATRSNTPIWMPATPSLGA